MMSVSIIAPAEVSSSLSHDRNVELQPIATTLHIPFIVSSEYTRNINAIKRKGLFITAVLLSHYRPSSSPHPLLPPADLERSKIGTGPVTGPYCGAV